MVTFYANIQKRINKAAPQAYTFYFENKRKAFEIFSIQFFF